jgi:hypothetical protein
MAASLPADLSKRSSCLEAPAALYLLVCHDIILFEPAFNLGDLLA